MSERTENIDDELGSYSVDDEDQLQADDTLISDGVDDPLDRGYSPPDRPPTGWVEKPNTLDQRLREEEDDPYTRVGSDSGETDDDGDDDWEDPEVGDERAGRLASPDGDDQADTFGRDVGVDGGAASAEEAAVHVIGDE